MNQTINQSNSSKMETNITSNESYGQQDFSLEKISSWTIPQNKLKKHLSAHNEGMDVQSNLKFNAEPFCYGKSQKIS